MRTLIVIPALNEESVLPAVLDDLKNNAAGFDVLVINDGSTDHTSDVARDFGVMVIDLPFNLGIGGAMQSGFIYASRNGYSAVVQFDADGQHRADQLKHILKPLEQGMAKMVVGSRFIGAVGYDVSFPRKIGIKFFSFLLTLITRNRLSDTTSGFRAYGKEAVDTFANYYPDDYPEVEAIIILHNKRMKVMEVPVLMRERLYGESTITPIKSIYYMIKVCLSILLSIGRRID